MHCRCPPWPQQNRQRHRQTPSAAPLQPKPSLNHHNPTQLLIYQTHKILLRLHCKNHSTKQTNQDAAADGAGRDSEVELRRHCKQGHLQEALETLRRMADSAAYAAVLHACAAAGPDALKYAQALHRLLRKHRHDRDPVLVPVLVHAFCACGGLLDARLLLDKAVAADVDADPVSLFRLMLCAYVRHGCFREALLLHARMPPASRSDDAAVALALAVKSARALRLLQTGRALHGRAVRSELHGDGGVRSALVALYSDCGAVGTARRVFDTAPPAERSAATWNSMISGYAHAGDSAGALNLLRRMDRRPDLVTVVSALPACTEARDVRALHGVALRAGLAEAVAVGNSLVKAYGGVGARGVLNAAAVFESMPRRDAVSWNSLMSAFADTGEHARAVELFRRMDAERVPVNPYTLSSLLASCARAVDLEQGHRVHGYAVRAAVAADVSVANSLLQMYVRCGRLRRAQRVFEEMPRRDAVSWNTMLGGLHGAGRSREALELFRRMDFPASLVTCLCLLSVSAELRIPLHGREVHAYMLKTGLLQANAAAGNAVVAMYSKCGHLRDAAAALPAEPDAAAWTAMIQGYGARGRAGEALAVFEEMAASRNRRVRPNGVTMLVLLCVCGRGGLVERGKRLFQDMEAVHGVPATVKHCTAMVDLLGRAGMFREAREFIERMPAEPDAAVWGALLGAFRIHGRFSALAEQCARMVLRLAPYSYGHWVLVQRVYMDARKWDAVARIRAVMRRRGLIRRPPACSWIEVDGQIHAFVAGERCSWVVGSDGARHPGMVESNGVDRSPGLQWVVGSDGADGDRLLWRAERIDEVLGKWAAEMAEEGFRWPGNFVVSNELDAVASEEDVVCRHTEKLAVAFGLVATPRLKKLRVVKNVKVCRYCHDALRFVSKVSGREITVQDPEHVHVFRNGYCCCGS